MVKFALSKNPQAETPPKKGTKKFTHLECGNPLEQHENGQWFCVPCRKIGYLVGD